MKKTVIESARMKERMIVEVLANGLQVCVMERRGMQQTVGALGVRTAAGSGKMERGTQHFLEHMMFKQPNGEMMNRVFAARDATITAYTTQEMTTYLFTCMDQVGENLQVLMDMVNTPHFPQDLVEEECRVIEKEIAMYERDEDNRAQLRLLAALYGEEHPLATDILGTRESIRAIDSEQLQRVYEQYYRPDEMVLLVIGDVQAEAVMSVVRTHPLAVKKSDAESAAHRAGTVEPMPHADLQAIVYESEEEEGQFILNYGMREETAGRSPEDLLRRELTAQAVLQALHGERSPLERQLSERGLLAGEWAWMTDYNTGYAYSSFGGRTSDPEAVRRLVEEHLCSAVEEGLPEAAFERARTKLLAHYIRGYDELEEFGLSVHQSLLRRTSYFRIEEILRTMTCEEANGRCRELFQTVRQA